MKNTKISKSKVENTIFIEIIEAINEKYGLYEANNPCYDIDFISRKIVEKLYEENMIKED